MFLKRTLLPLALAAFPASAFFSPPSPPSFLHSSLSALLIRPGGDHGDMTYVPENVMRQSSHYSAIRAVGGPSSANDVYVRAPGGPADRLWFYIGKTARCTGTVSDMECVARQRPLIIEHAARLRPRDVGKNFGGGGMLEVWIAPGDSELDVAYNRPELVMKMVHPELEAEHVEALEVGFVGEIYEGGEEGFRTERTLDGRAARPEVNAGMDRTVSADEMERMIREKEKK